MVDCRWSEGILCLKAIYLYSEEMSEVAATRNAIPPRRNAINTNTKAQPPANDFVVIFRRCYQRQFPCVRRPTGAHQNVLQNNKIIFAGLSVRYARLRSTYFTGLTHGILQSWSEVESLRQKI